MKFIHCSDLHIDSRMKTNLNSQQASERKKEILLSFERMIRYAREVGVRAIIIAGDMFDTVHVSASSKKRIFDLISEYSDIDFLYLVGNHDEENILSQYERELDNLKVFVDQWTSFDYGDVVITGMKLTKSTNYELLDLDKDKLNIVVLHGQISQYNSISDDETIPLPRLKDKNIDYLALGHIHSYESSRLDNRGVYCYSGCMEGRGFDECGTKGFVLIDTENGHVSHEFVPFATRSLVEIDYDISNDTDWFEIESGIFRATEDIDPKSLVKVTLVGKFSLDMQKHTELCARKLNEKFYFAKIKDDTRLKLEEKDYMLDPSLKGEFIRRVMNSSLSSEEKDSVILVGVKALDGEDLL